MDDSDILSDVSVGDPQFTISPTIPVPEYHDTYEYSPSENSDANMFSDYPSREPTPGSTGEHFKNQIKKLEKEIHRMHKKHCKLIKDMDSNYASIEEETHQRYIEFIQKWKDEVKQKLMEYKDTLENLNTEKNEIKQETTRKINQLHNKFNTFNQEKLDFLQKYSEGISSKEAQCNQAIEGLRFSYEKQIGPFSQEKRELEQQVEEVLQEKDIVQAENQKLIEKFEQLEQELTESQERLKELQAAKQSEGATTLNEFDDEIIQMMLQQITANIEMNDLVERTTQRFQAIDKILATAQEDAKTQERDQFMQIYNEQRDKLNDMKKKKQAFRQQIANWIKGFEDKYGRKPTNADKAAAKPLYSRYMTCNKQMERLVNQIEETRKKAAEKGIHIGDKTNARSRSMSPKAGPSALNISVDSMISTPRAGAMRWNTIIENKEPDEAQRLLNERLEDIGREKLRLQSFLKGGNVGTVGTPMSKTIGSHFEESKDLKIERDSLKKELEQLQEQAMILEAVKPKVLVLEESKMKMIESKKRLEYIDSEVQMIKSRRNAETAEIQRQTDKKVNQWEEEFDKMLDQEDQLGDELKGYVSQAREIENNIETKRKEYSALQDEAQQLRQAAGDIVELNEVLKQLQAKNFELRNENATKEEEYKKCMVAEKYLRNQVEDLQGNIRVFCIVKPQLNYDHESVVSIPNEFTLKCGINSYTLDSIYGPESTVEQVIRDTKEVVQHAVDGFNVCLIAQGASGTGKTATMFGPHNTAGLLAGLLEQLDTTLASLEVGAELSLTAIEVVHEQVHDLQGSSRENLQIKQDYKDQVIVPDAICHTVKSTLLLSQVKLALENRSANSSVFVTIQIDITNSHLDQRTVGKLNLIDLYAGITPALSDVTDALLNEARRYIPYGDSKATLLLSDFLGGDAKTLLLSHITGLDARESNSTLTLATKIKKVQNNPTKNIESRELTQLKQRITEAEAQTNLCKFVLEQGEIPDSRLKQLLAVHSAITQ